MGVFVAPSEVLYLPESSSLPRTWQGSDQVQRNTATGVAGSTPKLESDPRSAAGAHNVPAARRESP
jgi:hypothetical protein